MIGRLDQRVTIRRRVRTDDDMGGGAIAWTDVATVWAHMRPKSGRERAAYGSVEASAMYHCVMREPIDVRETDAVIWRGESFNVRFVGRKGRAMYVEVDLERGVAL
jgi:SPP1 family predicted phage head-tail adaptor